MPTVDQLREALRQKNLDTKGRKAELEARLAAANASGESPGEDKFKAIEKQLADLQAALQAALPAGGGEAPAAPAQPAAGGKAPAQLELDKLAAIDDVEELQKLATERGLAATGNKKQLRKRLREWNEKKAEDEDSDVEETKPPQKKKKGKDPDFKVGEIVKYLGQIYSISKDMTAIADDPLFMLSSAEHGTVYAKSEQIEKVGGMV